MLKFKINITKETAAYVLYILGLNALTVFAVYQAYIISGSLLFPALALAFTFIAQGFFVFLNPKRRLIRVLPIVPFFLTPFILKAENANSMLALFFIANLALSYWVRGFLYHNRHLKNQLDKVFLWFYPSGFAFASLLLIFNLSYPIIAAGIFFALCTILSFTLKSRYLETVPDKPSLTVFKSFKGYTEFSGFIVFIAANSLAVSFLSFKSFLTLSGTSPSISFPHNGGYSFIMESLISGGIIYGGFLVSSNLGKILRAYIIKFLRVDLLHKILLVIPGIILLFYNPFSTAASIIQLIFGLGFLLGLQEAFVLAFLKVTEREKFNEIIDLINKLMSVMMPVFIILFGYFYNYSLDALKSAPLAFAGSAGWTQIEGGIINTIVKAAGILMLITGIMELKRCIRLEKYY